MKLSEIRPYKGFGTIEMTLNEDGRKCYIYNHTFFNNPSEEDTIKGAMEMLDYYERKAQEIRSAIDCLGRNGYKVFKEIA